MKIESKISGQGEWVIQQTLKDDADQHYLLVEKELCLTGNKDSIRSYQLNGNRFLLADTRIIPSGPETMYTKIDQECMVMDFIYQPAGRQLQGHNIWYDPHYQAALTLTAGEEFHQLIIILPKEVYSSMINFNEALHQQFSAQLFDQKAAALSPVYLPITAAMKWIIHEIKTCGLKDDLKILYTETKIRELLLLQLEQLTHPAAAGNTAATTADFARLQEAKRILDEEYIRAPTLTELSRKISLNEFKLKKGFKACFGYTVRGYIIKLRMEHAKELFKSKVVPVSEVAYKCGYKDVSHFSAAFKSFYGFSPQQSKISRTF